MKEHNVGEIVILGITEVVADKDTLTCEKCFFNNISDCCSSVKCLPAERSDGKQVIYTEIK